MRYIAVVPWMVLLLVVVVGFASVIGTISCCPIIDVHCLYFTIKVINLSLINLLVNFN